ncbi:transposase [Rhizobium leguminosarum]|nr:transposase [Rhizobium leguminosarum]
MIFPSNRVRIMVATKPVDFRKGHDGLAALVKNELHKDPFTGTVFVYTRVAILTGFMKQKECRL